MKLTFIWRSLLFLRPSVCDLATATKSFVRFSRNLVIIRVSIYKMCQTRVSFVISYPCEVLNKIFALVGSYATDISGSGQHIGPFVKGQAVPVFLRCLTVEDRNDKASRNAGNYQSTLLNIKEERRSHLQRGEILKSREVSNLGTKIRQLGNFTVRHSFLCHITLRFLWPAGEFLRWRIL